MMLFTKDSASSTSLAAMLLVSAVGFIVLTIIGPYFRPTDAFQLNNRCFGRRHGTPKSASFAARHDGDASRPATIHLKSTGVRNSGSNNNDIAKVWANSLESKIPWHAGSRRYLSDGPDPLLTPDGGEENEIDSQEQPHETATP
jgi:hypothetical protein